MRRLWDCVSHDALRLLPCAAISKRERSREQARPSILRPSAKRAVQRQEQPSRWIERPELESPAARGTWLRARRGKSLRQKAKGKTPRRVEPFAPIWAKSGKPHKSRIRTKGQKREQAEMHRLRKR